ncbi:hypothetical protein VTK73DRAFT_3229 [Phialemonium thermophilum]|uniref:C2 domain-containing protein n=1 Tax=Phialemonium thermophilum TaxID=223376 RepID=A0ABR3Y7F1_9PEZI
MSSASRSSWNANRRLGSVQSTRSVGGRHGRAGSRARQKLVGHDDAYSFSLRVAFLNYLLQPRKKQKQYVPAPKQPARTHTILSGELLKEIGFTSSHTTKLPSGFRSHLEKRMTGVLQGTEKMAGYNDAALKRTFAEAWTAFTAESFRRSIDKDRRVEPLVLIFYSAATKAQGRGKDPHDQSWKALVDRHLAMFVRLLSSVLKEMGGDRHLPELANRLTTLENKFLTNDQNLYLDNGQDSEQKYVEVDVPLSYLVEDMPLVQVVAKIFGVTLSKVQSDIDSNMAFWTEDAALKDYKHYQYRLAANMTGTLSRQDFDLDESFDEWRKNEGHHLGQIFSEILIARPDLRGVSSSPNKAQPPRPQSMYGEDQAYADLSKMLSNPASGSLAFDQPVSMGSASLDESASIRSVDEPSFTFIPPDPRAFYRTILQYCMSFDLLHSDPAAPYTPLSEESSELLVELAIRWRIPQFTRHIAFVEVAARKFLDQEITVDQLDIALESTKIPAREPKKAPPIQGYTFALTEIDPSRWTLTDFAVYQQTLRDLHDALMRDLFGLLMRCYEPKPPSISAVMLVLGRHILDDPAFSHRPEEEEEFARQLGDGLRQRAAEVYRDYTDTYIPENREDWNFAHVVKLGKAVVSLCDRIRKRYRKNPEIMGVDPFKVLVETMFPIFEEDANAFILQVLQVAKEKGIEIHLQDGFDLYKELVEIRKIHLASLPSKPFAFHIESLLEDFVWRWIRGAEDRMVEYVEASVKQDKFEVRRIGGEALPTDEDRHSVSVIDMFTLFNQTVDQVFKLEWNDDVHHARFMTALSRAFSSAIGRYCELVEQGFASDMQKAASQDAAGQKTTQEKFLQYAKDAWAKEKIEPFQFFPQSFVRLNNIEYAIQALDKLEKLMNVDGCVAALQRVEGLKPKTKRPNKYIFTIKVIEAEDIKACDPNGTSDPYVILCDEYQKRLAKTRVVMRSLNPRWDESVDITVSGPLNIIATIWDYDTFGDDDFVGRTSLKLDPVHFSDYLPREFWLDLDTQGRLLLRVSMEGERDDIQFYFGKAFRHLKRTERDMVRSITDKLSTHINASLSHEALHSLLNRGIAASVASLWKKRQSAAPAYSAADVENALQSLFTYFNENFAIMNQTLTRATMLAVMTRLWKEVLMAIENLLVPPLSEKPSLQKPLSQAEVDIVFQWLQLLFDFFNAKDEHGEVLGVPVDILKSPKWHDLQSLNFFYFESTENLKRISERMAAATAQRAQEQLRSANASQNRLSAPAILGAPIAAAGAFGSLGTIRRGRSIMMSRNLGTMRRAKEEKWKEAQADPSDDMILRILRMRPEAAGYLKERHRQKERQAAAQAAAAIVQRSVQGNAPGLAFGAGVSPYGRNNLPMR